MWPESYMYDFDPFKFIQIFLMDQNIVYPGQYSQWTWKRCSFFLFLSRNFVVLRDKVSWECLLHPYGNFCLYFISFYPLLREKSWNLHVEILNSNWTFVYFSLFLFYGFLILLGANILRVLMSSWFILLSLWGDTL